MLVLAAHELKEINYSELREDLIFNTSQNTLPSPSEKGRG